MPMCTVCDRRGAIFKRVYSGQQLCARCFCRSIEQKVQATASKYEMLQPDDKIMVAVSGGKDSVVLLRLLARMEEAFPKTTLRAVTIDEGVRGYRDEALEIAVKNCQELGVEHTVVSFKGMFGYELDRLVTLIREKGMKGLTPCAYCGVLRRQALNVAAREAGADKLATGHSLDDETQTMLLNIIHGDALRIARVAPVLPVAHPKLVQRIKPVCEVLEREIVLYAYLKKLRFHDTPCPYAGTALRNDVRSMLNRMEQKHPGTKFAIYRSIERIRPGLESLAKDGALQNCRFCGEPTVAQTCRSCQMLRELGIS
ncbi:MAG: TIGR00269 family protein [Candidatus Bathyarchaeota archaeon]|nr:MAG: TIGR00269 family protein [Candidatus Bathyarchaeota archaeon]